MAWYPIGPSSYPDLFGQTQYVNSKRIADQFQSLQRDYAVEFGGNGDRLSANEGRRTRARQSYLWANRVALGITVASPFTSRHDEVTHGNAIDVGVTMANGQNRALTAAEFAWMHTNAERRGFTWTGRYFNEPWHIEGATRTEIVAPYPDIVAGVPPVINQNDSIVNPLEDELVLIEHKSRGQALIGAGYVSFLTSEEAGADIGQIASKHVVAESARQFDLWVAAATLARSKK